MTIQNVSINTDQNPAVAALQAQLALLIKDVFAVGGPAAAAGQSWFHAGSSDPVAFPADATDLPTALLLGNALRIAWLAHLANTDAHKVADTTTILTAPVATDQATLNALLTEIKADLGTHLASTTFHGVADATNTVATPDATTLGTALTLANALKPKFNAHTAGGMKSGAVRTVGL